MKNNRGEYLIWYCNFEASVLKMEKDPIDEIIHFKHKRIKCFEYLSSSCHNNKKGFIVKSARNYPKSQTFARKIINRFFIINIWNCLMDTFIHKPVCGLIVLCEHIVWAKFAYLPVSHYQVKLIKTVLVSVSEK